MLHRFGYNLEDIDSDEDLAKALDEYKERIQETKVNNKNAEWYVKTFLQRDDISARLSKIPDDMLLICGSRSAYAHNMETMFQHCNRTKVSNLKIDDIGDVLEDAPSKLANSLLLFCKGLGWLTTLQHPGVERQRSASQSSTGSGSGGPNLGRRMSMEEYDRPNIRRLSLTGVTSGGDKEWEDVCYMCIREIRLDKDRVIVRSKQAGSSSGHYFLYKILKEKGQKSETFSFSL